MLPVVSSEPVSPDTESPCVLRGSRTHCALQEDPQVKEQSHEGLVVQSYSSRGPI